MKGQGESICKVGVCISESLVNATYCIPKANALWIVHPWAMDSLPLLSSRSIHSQTWLRKTKASLFLKNQLAPLCMTKILFSTSPGEMLLTGNSEYISIFL